MLNLHEQNKAIKAILWPIGFCFFSPSFVESNAKSQRFSYIFSLEKIYILTSSAFFINLYHLLMCYTGSTLGTQHVGKLLIEKQTVLRQVNIKQLLSGFVMSQLLHS